MGDVVDVVIVGAWSAGAVLAARLSQCASTRVVLLEAGADHRSAGAPAGVRSANYLRSFGEPGRLWSALKPLRDATGPCVDVHAATSKAAATINATRRMLRAFITPLSQPAFHWVSMQLPAAPESRRRAQRGRVSARV